MNFYLRLIFYLNNILKIITSKKKFRNKSNILMKQIVQKANQIYTKGSEEGITWFKTAVYYSFIPTVLYLGKIIGIYMGLYVNYFKGLKSMDFKSLLNAFKGVDSF